MSTISAVEAGIYLYGIIDAHDGAHFSTAGIEGGAVETVEVDGIMAVVTRLARPRVRAQRANLAAHHNLLRGLAERQAVLPCAFGTVSTGEDELRDVLAANRDGLLAQLARLRGKVEMSLSVYWNTSNIFEFFVAGNEELRQMRDRIFRPGREPSMDERMELGRRFEAALTQSRELHTRQVTDALRPYCTEIRPVDPGQEQMIMKLVCLVHHDQQSRFDEGIQEAARKFDDRYCFKYAGPWAPFDFVDLNLHLS